MLRVAFYPRQKKRLCHNNKHLNDDDIVSTWAKYSGKGKLESLTFAENETKNHWKIQWKLSTLHVLRWSFLQDRSTFLFSLRSRFEMIGMTFRRRINLITTKMWQLWVGEKDLSRAGIKKFVYSSSSSGIIIAIIKLDCFYGTMVLQAWPWQANRLKYFKVPALTVWWQFHFGCDVWFH